MLAGLTVWAHRNGDARLAGIAALASLGFILLIAIFILPPLARSAGTEAAQLDLPFDFTTGGAIYLTILVIIGFAAYNTGNNLLFIVLAFLISAFIVSFIAGNFCLKKLDVKMRFPETIFANEPTPLVVSLHNKKRIFPTYSVMTEVRGKEREKSALLSETEKILPKRLAERILRPPLLKHTLDYFVYIPRRRSLENKTEHIFPNRGRFIIKDFELSTGFPFGFFRHRRRLSAQEAEILIFPKISPVETEMIQTPFETGSRVLARKGAGQDLLMLRDYQLQDDFRRIDWKATARAQKIIVREFAAEDERRVTIVLDTNLKLSQEDFAKTFRERVEEEQKGKKTTMISQRFEKGVAQTASLLAYFYEERAEFRLAINEEIGEFGFGKDHLYNCLKRLSVIEPSIYENTSEFSVKIGEELENSRVNTYTFIITGRRSDEIPDDINRRAKILHY